MSEQQDLKWLLLLPSFARKRIEGRHNLQKILNNIGWLFFDKILRMGVGLFIGAWVARYLGPEQFGAFNFAIAFVALFGVFASLGLDGIVVRDIVREPDKRFEILSVVFLLKLCGGCVALLISLSAIYLMRPNEGQTHWLVGIIAAGLIIQSLDTLDLWFQYQVKSKYTVIAKNSAFVVFTLVRIVLVLKKAPLVAFAWSSFAEIILGAVFMIIFFLRQKMLLVWCPKVDTACRLLRESWPLILSGLAVMTYMRIDQIMLGQMLGNKEVGLYSAALRFSEIWYFIPIGIISSVMPSLTQVRSESEKIYYQRLQQLFNNLVRIAYVIAIPMTFFSTFMVTSLYGQEYSKSGLILAIHIWSAVFVFIGVGMSPWTINEGMMRWSLIQPTVGVIVNICLNTILIPIYGAVGAAIATLVSQIMASFVINLTVPKLRIIFKMQLKALLRPI